MLYSGKGDHTGELGGVKRGFIFLALTGIGDSFPSGGTRDATL
jgi:hypothetical protein